MRGRQLGNDLLVLEIKGGVLALPTFHGLDGAAGCLRWRDTRHKKADAAKPYVVELGLPLAQRLTLLKEGNGLRMEISGRKPLKLNAVRGMSGSDRVTVELQSDGASTTAPQNGTDDAQDGPAFFDTPVTLELRDVSAYEAFHVLAACAGVNLLFEAAMPAKKVSLSFRDVTFRQVFSYLLRTYDFRYGIADGTLVVGRAEQIGKILGLNRTKAYTVAYADIAKISPLLYTLADLSVTPVADPRMRQLYVTGTEAQHRRARAVLERLDHPGRQVMLEARLVEVNKDAQEELETLITAVYKGWIFSSGVEGGGALAYTYANRGDDFPGVVDSTLKMLDAGLRAIETKNRGRVLASPSVMALDGERALIKLTRNYLYQSSLDDKGNAEFTEQETGPTLEITPFIGRDGYITLRLNISTGEIIGFRKSGMSEAPETTKRELETRIRVRDGELFVIGGLYQESQSKSVTRVPVLGYVPLLGELFTSRQSRSVKSEMAFIVVPHILDIPYSGAESFSLGEERADSLRERVQ